MDIETFRWLVGLSVASALGLIGLFLTVIKLAAAARKVLRDEIAKCSSKEMCHEQQRNNERAFDQFATDMRDFTQAINSVRNRSG